MKSNPFKTPNPPDRGTRPLSLRHNFSWTLVGNVIFAGCQWLTLVILAKAGTPEAVGQYALALAIATPVLALSNLQLRVLQSTDANRNFAFSDYLTVRLVMTVLALAVIAIIVGFNQYALQMTLIALAVGLTKSIDAISDVSYGLLQQRERMDRIAISLILHGIVHVALFSVIFVFTESVFIAVLAMALVSAIILVAYDLPNAGALLKNPDAARAKQYGRAGSGLRPSWNSTAFRKIVWLGLPIGLVTTLNSLTGNVPRYFIVESLGERELGIFAAMFYLTIAGSMIMGAIGHPASPRLANMFAVGDLAGYKKLLTKLVGIALSTGIAGFIVAFIAGEPILTLLYTPEYAEHMTTFLWLMAATSPMYIASVLGVGVNAMRRFHIQVPLPVLNLIFATVLATILIPRYGLNGAGQVIFLSATLSMLATFFVLMLCLKNGDKAKNVRDGNPRND